MPMNFDNRPYLTDRSGDGQLYHSPDSQLAIYNCTMEALRETARDYLYGEPFNDDELRAFGAPGSTMGLPWEVSLTAASRAFPKLRPDMGIFWPSDLIGTVRLFGRRGWLMHAGFKCDASANVPPIGPVTYSHAERILWADDNGIGMENVEPHPDVYLTDQQFIDLYDGGGLLVFQRSLIPPPIQIIPTEDDDMYRDLAPGETWPAAVAPNTNYNFASEAGSSIHADAYHPDGTPIAGKDYGVPGNVALPGKGPIQSFDSAAGIGIGSDGGTVVFRNSGQNPVTIWLHRE